MKTSATFLLFMLSHFFLLAQEGTLLNRSVNVNFRNTSIEEILKAMESEDLSFVYSPEVFDVKKRVSINLQNTRLSVVLSQLFAGQQMEMREVRGQILLRKKLIPKEVKNNESIDTAQVKAPIKQEPSKTVKSDASDPKEQKVDRDSTHSDTAYSLSKAELTLPEETVNDSLDSFGANTNGTKEEVLIRRNNFIPRWSFKPYQPLQASSKPALLNYSRIKPRYAQPSPNQKSIWDEMAQSNKKNRVRESKEEKPKPDKKFRMGLGFYTGYTEFDQTEALLLGGRLIYYPSASLGVGFSGNALMSRGFFNQELNDEIRLEGGYGGLSFEYILFPQSVVHLSLPITIGAGGFSYIDADNPIGVVGPRDSQAFFMIEAGAEVEFNIAKFMKIALGASYRDVSGSGILNQNNQEEIVSASVLEGMSYGITLKFGRF